MTVWFFTATVVLYFLGTASALADLLRRSEALSKISVWITGAGFLTHTIALVSRLMTAGHVPLTSLHEALSFFSWALVLVFLVMELRQHVHVLGSFILPLALISLLSAAALPARRRSGRCSPRSACT